MTNGTRVIWTSNGGKRGPNTRTGRIKTQLYGHGSHRERLGPYVVEVTGGLPGENGTHRLVPGERLIAA